MQTGAGAVTADHDVVVIGGGLAGSSAGLLLRRALPDCRVLIVERSEEFERKVGEATVEVSGHFLAHVLRLYGTLSREHLSKHGLRYFFTDGRGRALAEMSEVGTTSQPPLPTFQLDRARLDKTVLELAEREGALVVRPGRVTDHRPSWPVSTVELEDSEGQRRVVTARWVLDATGRRTFLARRLGLLERLPGHRTAAMWGHWRGTLDLDGLEALGPDPRVPGLPETHCARDLATNHFCGRGWWSWVIRLASGSTSIGVVYDKRLFEPPAVGHGSLERYRRFLESRDGLREIVAGATLDEESFRFRDNLAYRAARYMDLGWALVGDAAAFLDPYYSPGLDHLAMSVHATTRLIEEQLRGEHSEEALSRAITEHNESFARSYTRWYEGLYRDKYELLGDAELTATAFYLDTAMYHLGVVHTVYHDLEELRTPTLGSSGLQAWLAYRVLRFTRRRLVTLARRRLRRGTYGRRNVGWRTTVPDFGTARLRLTAAHRRGLALWAAAELENLLDHLRPRRRTRNAGALQEVRGTRRSEA